MKHQIESNRIAHTNENCISVRKLQSFLIHTYYSFWIYLHVFFIKYDSIFECSFLNKQIASFRNQRIFLMFQDNMDRLQMLKGQITIQNLFIKRIWSWNGFNRPKVSSSHFLAFSIEKIFVVLFNNWNNFAWWFTPWNWPNR